MSARLSLLTVLSLTACSLEAADDPFDAPLEAEQDENTLDHQAPSALAADEPMSVASMSACPGASMIGILDQAGYSCQLPNLPDGWSATRLFTDGSPGVSSLSISVPNELGRFCRFDIVDEAEADVVELQDAVEQSAFMDVGTLGPDCRGLAGQGDGLRSPAVGQALRQAFRANIDWVSGAELSGYEAGRTPVFIGMPDTISDAAMNNPAIVPTNAHGMFMASIIEDIACPGGTAGCTAAVHPTLATPRNEWGTAPNYGEGGPHGTQSDMALAVYEAVASWQEQYDPSDPNTAPRLVINLSVGFERQLDVTGGPGRGPSKSLTTALQHASCQGALIIAAAGNAPIDACPEEQDGPLAPASFETMPAPTALECTNLGFNPIVDTNQWPIFTPGSGRPLVYSIAGVDGRDLPLGNAREASRSRIAALGSNAVGPMGSSYDPGITGSSVSAAVGSGIASVVWQFRPELEPHELMTLIYDAGYGLTDEGGAPLMADFGLAGALLQQVRRASVCAALDAACDTPGAAACPPLSCPAQAPAVDGNLTPYFGAVQTAMTDPSNSVVNVPVGDPDGIGASCVPVGPNNLHEPQPDLPVCARCNLSVDSSSGTADDTLKMSIEPEYQGAIEGAWLYVRDDQGHREYDLVDVLNQLNSANIEIVTVDVDASAEASEAILVFELDLGDEELATHEQPIILDHSS